jgi:hypothetical protein
VRFVRPEVARPRGRNAWAHVLLVGLAVGGVGGVAALTLSESTPVADRGSRPAPLQPTVPARPLTPVPATPAPAPPETPLRPVARDTTPRHETPAPPLRPTLPAREPTPSSYAPEREMSWIQGIPGECRIDVARLRQDQLTPVTTVSASGRWLERACEPSPDGRTLLLQRTAGVTLVRGGRSIDYEVPMRGGMRAIQWSPDGRRFAFWHPEGVAVFDAQDIDHPRPNFWVAYRPTRDRQPFALAWADARDLLILEHRDGVPDPAGRAGVRLGSDIVRVSSEGGSPRPFLESPDQRIGFFLPLRHAGGLAGIVFSVKSGIDPGQLRFAGERGEDLGAVAFPTDSIELACVSPRGTEVVVGLRAPRLDAEKKVFRGLYLIHLGPDGGLEQLTEDLSVHSAAFSPDGKTVAWATGAKVELRSVAASAKPTEVEGLEKVDGEKRIHDLSWSPDGARLALTAANALHLYDVASRRLVATIKQGDPDRSFVASPIWVGDEVLFSTFTNVAARGKKR